MIAILIVVVLELRELSLEIARCPKETMIEEFAPDCADYPFYKRMGHRHVGNRLDFFNLKNAEIGLPLVIVE